MSSLKSVILKIAGKCNINCSYCYMYNLVDQTHTVQPNRMRQATVDQIFQWIERYAEEKELNKFHISLHGGEPLLAGKELVKYIGATAQNRPSGSPKITLSLLTNGLLLDTEWIEIFTEFDIGFSISLDGPKEYHDRFRRTKSGMGTHDRVESVVKNLLKAPSESPTFSKATLCVLHPEMNGSTLIRYFYDLGLKKVDLLFPDQNHVFGSDCYPIPSNSNSYSRVLIDAYREWRRIDDPTFSVRKFELYIEAYLGLPVALDSVGKGPITVFTVETNGEIEAVDSMKICGSGFTKSGLFISDATPHDVENSPLIRMGLIKDEITVPKCLRCEYQNLCGSGYFPHRFKNGRFIETVYCADMIELCDFISTDVRSTLVSSA